MNLTFSTFLVLQQHAARHDVRAIEQFLLRDRCAKEATAVRQAKETGVACAGVSSRLSPREAREQFEALFVDDAQRRITNARIVATLNQQERQRVKLAALNAPYRRAEMA